MSWQLIYEIPNLELAANTSINIPFQFNDSLIIVEAICPNAKPTWYRAGWLYPVMDVPNVGRVRGISKNIYLNKQTLQFDQLLTATYSLEFVAVDWMPNITLNFWEHDMPLYPPINQTQPQLPPNDSFPDYQTYQGFNITTEPQTIAFANDKRRSISIYNASDTDVLYLDTNLDNLQSNNPLIVIPPKSRYIDDLGWRGEWHVISNNGTSASPTAIVLREFINGEPAIL